MSNTDAADVARRAAEIIQQKGHCRGVYGSSDGRVCLWGAVLEASGLNPLVDTIYNLPTEIHLPLARELRRKLPAGGTKLHPGSVFNDRPDTTTQDVAKVLLQVADRLEVA